MAQENMSESPLLQLSVKAESTAWVGIYMGLSAAQISARGKGLEEKAISQYLLFLLNQEQKLNEQSWAVIL